MKKNTSSRSFADYKPEAHAWITLASGEYYPDILPAACELYKPVLVMFGQLLRQAHSSEDLFRSICDLGEQWMRIQLARVFRKYVSPETPVEMLKKKTAVDVICHQFGKGFRRIAEVQKGYATRPIPDEALCAVLWEYKDRGKKGYDLTERLFAILRKAFPRLEITGPERAGKDIVLGAIFPQYTKPDRPVDFVIRNGDEVLAVGLARYDSDRGGAQEDDRTGQYRDCAQEILTYAKKHSLKTKVIFLNDGPGLLLGSMWDDYAYLEHTWPDLVKVVTLRMITERISLAWLQRRF
ncbi:MAG: bstEII [Deltaproteobacteria bacterium]|nr:bstEII [Deltaproteobacteria bacterium]